MPGKAVPGWVGCGLGSLGPGVLDSWPSHLDCEPVCASDGDDAGSLPRGTVFGAAVAGVESPLQALATAGKKGAAQMVSPCRNVTSL